MITIHLTEGPEIAATRRGVYLPIVMTAPLDPVGDFIRLLTTDERQCRPGLTVHPLLTLAAQQRAYGLAHGEPWAHVDSQGVTPNEHARRVGCRLPADYAEKGNNIESLVAGSASAEVMFAALASSPSHSDHIFGRGWLGHQRHVGIAMSEGGPLGWYWCVMIALCLESTTPRLKPGACP